MIARCLRTELAKTQSILAQEQDRCIKDYAVEVRERFLEIKLETYLRPPSGFLAMDSHSPGLPATDRWRFDVRRAMDREAGWRRCFRQEWQHDFRTLSVDIALRAMAHSASSSTFGPCLPSMSACFRFPPCTFHHSSEIRMHGRVHQGAQDGFFQQPSTLNFLCFAD